MKWLCFATVASWAEIALRNIRVRAQGGRDVT